MFKLIIMIFSVTALAQLLQLGIQPLLTFLYSKEVFGHYSVFFSLFTFLSVVCLFQYNNLVLIGKNNLSEVLNSGKFFIILLDFIVILSFLALYITDIYVNIGITDYINLFILIFLYSLSSIFRSSLIKLNKNKEYSFSILLKSFFISVSQVFFGVFDIKSGLIYGVILGELISLIYIILKSPSHSLFSINVKSAVATFIENKQFLVWTTLQEIVAVFAFVMPIFIINKNYGFALGGEFALAHKLIWSPAFLISQALSPVILKKISEESKDYMVFFDKRAIFIFLFLICPIAYYILGYLLPLILNNEWENVVWIAQLLLFWVSLFVISIPSRLYLRATNRQAIQLILDLSTILIFFIVFQVKLDISITIKILVFSGAVLNLALLIVGRYNFNKDQCCKFNVKNSMNVKDI